MTKSRTSGMKRAAAALLAILLVFLQFTPASICAVAPAFADTGDSLAPAQTDLLLSPQDDSNDLQAATPTYPGVCRIGNTYYSTIQAAYSAATDGAVIEVHKSCEITAVIAPPNVNVARSVTIKSIDPQHPVTISRGGNYTGRFFNLNNSSTTLNLENIIIDGKGVSSGNGGSLIYVDNGATLNLKDGVVLQGGKTTGNGGAVYMTNSGSVLTMSSGSLIDNCAAGNDGGGVYVNNGTFTMGEGAISNCTASDNGGGVFLNNGTFTMEKGSVISGCTAGTCGGGVYVYGAYNVDNGNYNSNFELNGGSILNCVANRGTLHAGGGISVWGGLVNINSGLIKGCSAPKAAGGAISVDHGNVAYINGGTITENWAKERGSAVEVHGNLYLAGGEITRNYTVGNGDGTGGGGAINFWDHDASRHLHVSGSPRVIHNYMPIGEARENYSTDDPECNKECNVDIYNHYHGQGETLSSIVVDEGKGLNPDAVIGVTTSTDQQKENGQFGIYYKSRNTNDFSYLDNISCFINDVNGDICGADGGEANNTTGRLIWSKGLKLQAKMYVKNTSSAVEIEGSAGTYGFTYSRGVTTATVIKSIDEVRRAHEEKMGYLSNVDFAGEFKYGLVPDDDKHVANLKSILTRADKKCSNYYSVEGAVDTYKYLDFSKVLTLYYQIKPAVTIAVLDRDSSSVIEGARFELYSGATKLWEGSTDAEGKLTIPWSGSESAGCGGATFEAGSAYTLVQVETDGTHVLPGGSWTISMSSAFALSMSTSASPAGENRTLDATQTAAGAFTLYNDTEPKVTFDANGGTISGSAQYTVDFSTTGTSATFEVPFVNATRPTYAFVSWTANSDGTGAAYRQGDTISFARTSDNDDVTLYAKWDPSVNLAVTATADNDNGHAYTLKVELSTDGGLTYGTVAEDVALEIAQGATTATVNVPVPKNVKARVTLNAPDYPIAVEYSAAGQTQYGSTATVDVGSAGVQVAYSLRYTLPSPTGYDVDMAPFAWVLGIGCAIAALGLLARKKA